MEEIPPLHPAEDGATVGLFWVSSDGVYMGAPAPEPVPNMVLTPLGPRVTGPQPRNWAWSDLAGLEITEVPTRSAPQRWATHAASFVAAALDAWMPSSPAEMTVSVIAPDGTYRTPVYSSAAVAYSPREVALSRRLISDFTQGTATPAVMTEWWEQTRPTKILRSREREAVLALWLARA